MLPEVMEHDLTTCPACGLPAEVLYRAPLQSTEGPVEHAKVQCVTGHWFFMETPPEPPLPARDPSARTVRSR
jgi:hypothetical protein